MAPAEEEFAGESPSRRYWPRKWRWRISLTALILVIATLLVAYSARERIARNIIAEQLDALDLPATYQIGEIGPEKQVLKNIVIGDPDRPDLTVEQAEITLVYRWFSPSIGRVTLIKPRLYGSYRDGTLSFGSLDTVLFRDTGQPPGLPALDLALRDGRALLETDYGPVGLKAEGKGRLDGGFEGVLAATGPELEVGDCSLTGTTLYGAVSVSSGKPSLKGPLRTEAIDCGPTGAQLSFATFNLDVTADEDLAGVEGDTSIGARSLGYGENSGRALKGAASFAMRGDELNSGYDLSLERLRTPQVAMDALGAKGSLRSRGGFERVELQTDVSGSGVQTGDALDRTLASIQSSAADTLAEPLIAKFRSAFARESRRSDLEASLTLRKTGEVYSMVMPSARLRGGSGATLLALSRVEMSSAGAGPPRFSGNLMTGGEGMPQISGRMERTSGGDSALRLRMAEYSAGTDSIAVPEIAIVQGRSGAIGFSGQMQASGKLPGGEARNLVLPINGNWSQGAGLSLWKACTNVRFDSLTFANLTLERRGLTLCPGSSGAIVRQGPGGLKIAAGTPSLDLAGRLGGTPLRLKSGAVGFAYPGNLAARDLDVTLGPAGTASSFRISQLDATLGRTFAGTFSDADVKLDAVPLDLTETRGRWSYADGVLRLEDGEFRLLDRAESDRFNPLTARGATLSLADNLIVADAALRNPASDRLVTDVHIQHDLSSGTGFADLDVPGIRFDEQLQPDQLSELALGVVANADGVVTGKGRIDWNAAGVTSTGSFSTEGADFAAAFGPVKDASGTIVFTDLLALTTAPNQELTVGSVNPGIEVLDGVVGFDFRDGQYFSVNGGKWPFMGGTLELKPVNLNLGISETRRYVFEIVGAEAAQFVASFDLGNIQAEGTFDGTIPIEFDEQGNGRIDGGKLVSRPPGGNLSYVGELTYEDLTPMANFAFDALRSLNFTRMAVDLDGPLTGEIVTNLRFDGVSQGEGAKRNFVTRRIGRLPLEFRVNIRAPFYQLVTSIKAMYDPAYIRDPRELNLIDAQGNPIRRPAGAKLPDVTPDPSSKNKNADEPAIQTPESENTP